jgi:3'-phosphoadenosine 5'-phosphosulfate sulfotransferase (PAPS reductase)/FAD synthetase
MMKEVKVLQFSGGKDSLACLLLLKEQLNDIIVLWCDSGDSFPETKLQMRKVAELCPNFVAAHGNQPLQVADSGYPTDVLPIRNHVQIQYLAQQNRIKLQGFAECCNSNIWQPMHDATLALGATTIIRGQKLVDAHKSPIKNGDVVDGITYSFPLENWTDAQVLEFVKDSELLPATYAEGGTSLDCMTCTAYLAENNWKRHYLARVHPTVSEDVENRIDIIKHEVGKDMRHYDLRETL